MALVREASLEGRRVQVRSAGATLRLTVDGVLHTAWNPRLGVTRSVWDPLAFAAFLLPEGSVRRALLLGVGGGAVIHLLRRHVGPREIVAIEREPLYAQIALETFRAGGAGLRLVVDDAVAWVRRSRDGPPFDLVIDDVFGEDGREPVRAAGGVRWWRRLSGVVASGGLLVVNFADLRGLRTSALFADPVLRRRFPVAVRFACAGFTNAIVALGGPEADPAALRRRLRAAPTLRGEAGRALRFRAMRVGRWP